MIHPQIIPAIPRYTGILELAQWSPTMRILVSLTFMVLMITAPNASEAQRRYNVYKTDSFGNKGLFSKPEAIIEENSLTGDWEVYEPTMFGSPDTLRGPTYIIEKDSLSGLSDHVHDHHHLGDESLRDHHHHHDDGHDCDEEREE